MIDLSILYYTANRISDHFASEVRRRLGAQAGTFGLPIYAASQSADNSARFVSFGGVSPVRTLLQHGHRPSIWQVYRNILALAHLASTPYVACCEDDTLYAAGHFQYRPPEDVFGYNHSRYVITRRLSDDGTRREAFFYFRERTQMAMCICPRHLLIETLEERFRKYPEPVPHDIAKKTGWGEPGRYEKNLGLPLRKLEYFRSAEPNVTFNHGDSLMGRRKVNPDDILAKSVEPWGEANALWRDVYGE